MKMSDTVKTILNIAVMGSASLVFFLSSSASHAAMLPGSEPTEWPANPAKHIVSIKRAAKDDNEKKAIATAENLMPSKDDVLAASRKDQPDAAWMERQWWHRVQLGVKIPFAITTDAVTYYTDLVSGFGKQTLKRYIEPSSQFTYEASVSGHAVFEIDGKPFQNVTVVTLSLKFSQNFATTQTEGMSFEKKRTVVLDNTGKVLHVSGDGPTEVPILAI